MKELLQKLGIKAILLDLDDTLIETHIKFVKAKEIICARFCEVTSVNLEQMFLDWEECVLASREIHYINPIPHWTLAMQLMAEKHPLITEEMQGEATSYIFTEIYSKSNELKEGAIELLEAFVAAGMEIAIVTNAPHDWTDIKITAVGINNYVSSDKIFVITPDIRKGKQHWQQAMEVLGVAPEECIVFGDNFKADIKPKVELGGLAVFINAAGNWGVHTTDTDNTDRTNVIEITTLTEFEAKLTEWIENRELKITVA